MTKKSKILNNANNGPKKRLIDNIDAADALAILRILANEDVYLEKKIEQILKEYLSEVDIEEIASQVYFDLNGLEVEEVWDRSGSTRFGYVDPNEAAYEMFEEKINFLMVI